MAWIEKRPKGYIVRWYEPKDADGRRKTASAQRRTYDEARALKAEMESQIHRGIYVEKETRALPFGEYATQVLDADDNLADTTRANYEMCLGKQLKSLALVPIEHMDASRVRSLYGRLKGDGASPHVLNMVRKTISKVCSVAVEDGILARNPAKAVRAPETEARAVRPLSPTEVANVADSVPERWKAAVLLAAWGGLRIGEVGGLKVEDVDWDRGAVQIQRSMSASGPKKPKTKASRRVVTLPGWVMSELAEHQLRFPPNHEGYLFTTETGRPVHHVTMGHIMKKAGDVKFHDLRHTQAALLIKRGAHPLEIKQRLGHSSITTTIDTYGHLFEGAHDELARTLEQFNPGQMGKVVEL